MLQRQLVAAFVAERGPIETMEYSTFSDYGDDVFARVEEVGAAGLAAANVLTPKAERNAGLAEVTESIQSQLADEFAGREGEVKAAVRGLTKKLVRKRIVEEGLRIDGRTTTDIRPLSAEVDLFPTAHGSAPVPAGRDPGAQRHHPRACPA